MEATSSQIALLSVKSDSFSVGLPYIDTSALSDYLAKHMFIGIHIYLDCSVFVFSI